MSAITKPFLTTGSTSKPATAVNIERVSSFGKLDVSKNLGSGPTTGTDYQIVFSMFENDTAEKYIIWSYDLEATRDADLVLLIAAAATTLV